jgi:cobalt-zinc-cadmium efflux system membrane fusion protein
MFVIATTVLLGCPRAKDTPKKQEKAESAERDGGDHDHEGLPKVVHLSPEVFRAANLDVTPAKKEILRATLLLPGELAANPDRSGRISSTVPGRIEEVRFQEGVGVKKGDVLVVLRVPDLGKVRGAYSAAASKAKAARTNADRLKDLSENRLAANQAYLDAEAEAQSLDAEQKALAEQLTAIGAGGSSGTGFLLSLRAPVSGVVVKREAVVGQPVTADQTLGSVADLSEAWFLARVFEKDLGRLRQGASAEVELNAYPNERFEGSVEVLAQQIDPMARTLTARIGVKNRNGLLRVGLFGSARVDVGDDKTSVPVLVVPRSALTQINGKQIVFVRTTPETFDLHEVVLGESAVGSVRILAGLQEGEAVVTRGTFTLKSLVLKGTFAEEE